MTSVYKQDTSYPEAPGRGFGWMVGQPLFSGIVAFCAFEAAFYFAYRYGMSFGHATSSPFWFPDSVLLCALLLARPRWWWLIILAPLPIRLLVAVPVETPFWFLLATFAIDSAKGLLGAIVLRRCLAYPFRFETVREFVLYFVFAVLIIPAAAATLGAAARYALGFAYWPAWEQWFLGNALAHTVVTPLIFYWVIGAPRISLARWTEAALLTTGLIVSGYAAFEPDSSRTVFAEPLFYVPVLFLFWAAIRFGTLGTSGAVAVLSFFVVSAGLNGHGPFAGDSARDTAIAVQYFILLRAVPFYLVAVLIEEKQSVERVLRESESRFQNMANTAPVLIWMSGADRLREFFNQGWFEFTGRTLDQERGAGWAGGVYKEDLGRCLDAYHRAFEARHAFELEYRLRRRDGEHRWILEKGMPRFGPAGEFLGYIGSAIDITERKRAEEANRGLAHVSRLAVVGELTAMIAHEVNQPLGAILSNADAAEILLKSDDPPLHEIHEILADIRRDDLRAGETIRRTRELLRRRDMQMEPLDLNDIVADVLHLAAGDALRRRVQMRTELASALPVVSGDRVHLQHALLNLILNAMDAMAGKPAAARELTIRTSLDGSGGVEVAIVDRGTGIPAGRMSSIFDSFFSTKADGMGLGLSIARSIIAAHRGRIWAENNPGAGATFRFVLPPIPAGVAPASGRS